MNFIKEHIKKIAFFLIIICLIVLIGVTSIDVNKMNIGQNALGSIISQLQKSIYSVGQTLSNAFYSVQSISKTKEENTILQEELQKMQEENRILKNIVNKSDVLKSEYELKTKLKYDYVVGRVVALDDSNWFSRFTIDKGSIDGVHKNDIVIQAVENEKGLIQIGLIGIVTETGSNWSKIVTLIDESCKVSFRDINNDQCGILGGSISQKISGFFLDSKATAKVGDDIVTSGIGEVYLPDLYIGKVSEVVDTTDASNKKIMVDTAVDFTKLYKVFVLKIKG